jgi:hypothetical protein
LRTTTASSTIKMRMGGIPEVCFLAGTRRYSRRVPSPLDSIRLRDMKPIPN